MKTFADFLAWERASRDTIDFKKVYVDIAGDLNSGLMLSEIVYWYLPSKGSEENKLRITRDGYEWLAIRRIEWWDRTRLSPDQADRALGILEKAGIIVKARYKFGGEIATHIRLDEAVFMGKLQYAIDNPAVNPYVPTEMELGKSPNSNLAKVEIAIAEKPEILLTETTTKTTRKDNPPNPRKRGNKGRASKGDVYTTFEQLPIASTLYDLFSGGVVPAQNQLQAALMDYVKAAQELTARGETAERVKRAYCNMQRFATEQDWTKGFGLSAFMKRYVEMVDKYPNVPAAPAKALDLSEWTADSVWGWSAES